jgi:8-amino-7-oxononanoate synthase
LLTGNHPLYQETEIFICQFHQAEAALIFNSGYDANIGFFSAVPQRNDLIIYDEHCHASIRDGIQMSHSKAYKFRHNDLVDLEKVLTKWRPLPHNPLDPTSIFVVTESVFSMDGDSPDMVALANLIKQYHAYLVVDEAHALGVVGKNGEGLVQHLQLQEQVFARIITFGKALGCHGAAVLGSAALKTYLINFARSFIYTTGLSPHAIATVLIAYQHLAQCQNERAQLAQNIDWFKTCFAASGQLIPSNSAIQSVVISGNALTKKVAKALQDKGFDVKPILYPTVPKGQERLRFCLHSFTTKEQISELVACLKLNR